MSGTHSTLTGLRALYLDIVSGSRSGFLASGCRAALRVISVGYRLGLWLDSRRQRLTATRLSCKVISVGNITVGGTGKTPMVEWIAANLSEAGHRVAIVSRGYGAEQDAGMNDEGKVLAENLNAVPHVQDKNRVAACKAAIKNYDPEVIVLDDGFQHRRLYRDLDIVMVDATDPFGFGHLLPRGFLREPPKALRRADMVVISRCDQVSDEAMEALTQRIRTLAPEVTLAESVHEPISLHNLTDRETLRLDWFAWNQVAAFCGIANPGAFLRTLAKVGCKPSLFESFPDHNHYSHDQVEAFVTKAAKIGAEAVVTTQKDAVKLTDCNDLKLPVLQLKIQLRLRKGSELLTGWLRTLMTRAATASELPPSGSRDGG